MPPHPKLYTSLIWLNPLLIVQPLPFGHCSRRRPVHMILNDRIHRLLVLAEELHFSKAAERLHISQPALSGSLKSLEFDLGARLFHRTSRTVELTEAGKVLAAEARRLMQETARTVSLVRACPSDWIGPIRVAYDPAVNLHWLGAVIGAARSGGFPASDLHFQSVSPASIHERLAAGEYHAAILANESDVGDHAEFICRRLFCETLRPAFLPSLASGQPVSLAQLGDTPVIWLSAAAHPGLHRSFLEQCAAYAYRPNIVQEAGSFHECLEFARQKIGLTFLPAYMRPEGAESEVVLSCLLESLTIGYSLVCRTASAPAVERMVRIVRDQAPARAVRPGIADRSVSAINPKEQTMDRSVTRASK